MTAARTPSSQPGSSPPARDGAPAPADRLNALLTHLRKRHSPAVGVLAGQAQPPAEDGSAPAGVGPASQPSAEPVRLCAPLLEPDQPVLGEFVRSFLLWEAGSVKAGSAIKRIEQAVVDFNELRVCMNDELVRLLGKATPKAEERAMRMRAALNEIYTREHGMSLEHLPGLGKREAREYLESIEGVPRFVAARTLLVGMSGHAAPVDGRILRVLSGGGIVEPGSNTDDAAALLERKIRAGELLEAYLLLQAEADDPSTPEADAGPSGGAPPKPARARSNGASKPSPPSPRRGKA